MQARINQRGRKHVWGERTDSFSLGNSDANRACTAMIKKPIDLMVDPLRASGASRTEHQQLVRTFQVLFKRLPRTELSPRVEIRAVATDAELLQREMGRAVD